MHHDIAMCFLQKESENCAYCRGGIQSSNRIISIVGENMPQKPLTSKGKKSLPKLSAANRHGKVIKHKKGWFRTVMIS